MGTHIVKSNEIIHNIAKENSKSSEMLFAIFELNPDGISLTRVSDGKIIDCNQGISESNWLFTR